MLEWSAAILKSSTLSVAVFPAAFMLGIVGSVTSCCNLPVLGAIAGYSGTVGHDTDRRSLLVAALFFMLGTVGAFAALGAVSGFVGQVAGASLGLYWKLFAGFISVLFGLATLGLLPFDLTRLGFTGKCLADAIIRGNHLRSCSGWRGCRLFRVLQSDSSGSPCGDYFAGARPLGRSYPYGFLDWIQLADGRSPRWSGPGIQKADLGRSED